jgi:ribonuclease VapC
MPRKINSNEAQRGYILDSYALLAYFEGDPEGEKVEKLLKSALHEEVEIFMNVVTLGEVIYITEWERGPCKAQEVLAKREEFPIAIADSPV